MKTRSKLKKWIALALSLAMLFSLAACGGGDKGGKGAKTPEEVGSYILYEMEVDGELYDHDLIVDAGMEESWTLELKADGTGILTTEEDDGPDTAALKWGDGKITLVDENLTAPYTFSDGKLTFEMDGVKMTFQKGTASGAKDTSSLAESAESKVDEKNLSADQEFWDGDWYGFYYYDNATNDCETLLDVESDVMARISVEEDGTGTLVLWDDVSSQDDPVASVNIEIDEGGRLVSDNGSYLGCEIERADWLVDQDYSGYDNLACIEGTFTVPDDSFSHADYTIYLRPWGLDWADVEENSPDSLPYYYDWYLDQMNEDMPNAFPDEIWNSNSSSGNEELVPVGHEDIAIFGVEVPAGFTYNDGWSCYSDADYNVSIWLADARNYERQSEWDNGIDGLEISETMNLGGADVTLCEYPKGNYGATTYYFIDTSGFSDYVGCRIMVTASDGDMAATQSQEILDMIASLWLL